MARPIIWSPEAEEDYRTIQRYLLDHWSDKIAHRFADEVLAKSELLSSMPFLGKQTRKNSAVRQILVKPYYILYYLVERDRVTIVNLRDTRQAEPGLY